MGSRRVERFVALVPARAGSKGLPGKNFRMYAGKSLAEHAIRSATGCDYISETALSSDDPRAAQLAQAYSITFLPRAGWAASDTATASDVLRDAIEKWPAAAADSYLVYLQPTSPMRNANHVQDAIQKMLAGPYRSLVSVTESPVSAQKLVTVDDRGLLRSLFGDEAATSNRAELPPTLVPNGALYIFKVGDFLSSGSIPISGALPYLMSQRDSIDVDSPRDWERLMEVEDGNE